MGKVFDFKGVVLDGVAPRDATDRSEDVTATKDRCECCVSSSETT